ncbi:tetratricopeptide repeat protein [Aquirufa salirivi]|uniref:Tetratricopeptide repeat protein n=1 Tax=Aquirufa salirivi TaxID=3104729 RepID=A0ABW8RU35_9BACT
MMKANKSALFYRPIYLLLFLLGMATMISYPAYSQDSNINKSPSEQFRIAKDYYNAANYAAARMEFSLFLEKNAKDFDRNSNEIVDAEFFIVLCDFYINTTRAKVAVERFIANHPSSLKTSILVKEIGSFLYKAGQYQDAIQYIEQRVSILDPEIRFQLAICYLQVGLNTKALSLFELLSNDDNESVAYAASYYSGLLKLNQKQFSAAIFDLKKADEAPFQLAQVPLSDSVWAKIKRQIPTMITQAYYQMGPEKYAELIAYAEPIVLLDTREVEKSDIARLLGDIYFNQGKFSKSAEIYAKYLVLNESKRSVFQNNTEDIPLKQAFSLFKSRQYQASESLLKQVANNESLSDSLRQLVYYQIGMSQYYLKQYEAASNSLNQAIQINWNKSLAEDAYFNQLVALENQGDFDALMSKIKGFLQQYPQSKHLAKLNTMIIHAISESSILANRIYQVKEFFTYNYLQTEEFKKAYQERAYSLAVSLFDQENNLAQVDQLFALIEEVKAYPYNPQLVYLAKVLQGETYGFLAKAYLQKKNQKLTKEEEKVHQFYLNNLVQIYSSLHQSPIPTKLGSELTVDSSILKYQIKSALLNALIDLNQQRPLQLALASNLFHSPLANAATRKKVIEVWKYNSTKEASEYQENNLLAQTIGLLDIAYEKGSHEEKEGYLWDKIKILEKLRRYDDVSDLYGKFLKEFPNSKNKEIATLNQWISLYQKGGRENYVQAIKGFTEILQKNTKTSVHYKRALDFRSQTYEKLSILSQGEDQMSMGRLAIQDKEEQLASSQGDTIRVSVVNKLKNLYKRLNLEVEWVKKHYQEYGSEEKFWEDCVELYQSKRWDVARTTILEFQKIYPNSTNSNTLLKNLAACSDSLHDYPGAIEYYQQIIHKKEKFKQAEVISAAKRAGEIALENQQLETAIRSFQFIKSYTKVSRHQKMANENLVSIYLQTKQLDSLYNLTSTWDELYEVDEKNTLYQNYLQIAIEAQQPELVKKWLQKISVNNHLSPVVQQIVIGAEAELKYAQLLFQEKKHQELDELLDKTLIRKVITTNIRTKKTYFRGLLLYADNLMALDQKDKAMGYYTALSQNMAKENDIRNLAKSRLK